MGNVRLYCSVEGYVRFEYKDIYVSAQFFVQFTGKLEIANDFTPSL
jgi:hypothetical protein